MRTIFLYLFLGIITVFSCGETVAPKKTEESSKLIKKINNKKPFEPFALDGEHGQQFIFKGFEVTDQNAGAVAGIRVNLAFDFIHNGLAAKKMKRLLQFYLTIESAGQEIYNPINNPPTEKQDYYYHDEQSELIKSYRSPEEARLDTIHFQQSIFIPYFRLNAAAGNLDAILVLNLKNKKQALQWGKLLSVEAVFDKPKTVKATFALTTLNLDPTKKYDAEFGVPAKKKPDIQWFIRNDGYVFYSSEVKKDDYSASSQKVSFAFSEGDPLQFEVIDFDKGIANANDRIATIDIPYTTDGLEVKDFSKGDIVKLSYSLKITE